MLSTSVTLFERLRQPDNHEAWHRFVELYTPLLLYWARQQGLQETDAADLVQEVLLIVCQQLPSFEYDPSRRFRGWLRTIAVNKANEFHRRRMVGDRLASQIPPDACAAPDGEMFWEREYRQHLFARALQLMQNEFEPKTWRAALDSVTGDRPVGDVARDLGMSDAAVYQSRSRVLRRLRHELQGLWD